MIAAIPVRSFRFGKARLASALSNEARHRLGRGLASRMAETVFAVGWEPLVVSADIEVEAWAQENGLRFIKDPDKGLDLAAAAGVEAAAENGDRWLVIHSDLPLIAPSDLGGLEDLVEEGDVLAPSADGGTSLISASRPLEFAYGPGSFHRHLPLLTRPRVIALTGLLHDLDSPGDLASAIGHPRGKWLEGIY